jgi:multicomponent Na+:H+ antiporter subunit A
MEKMILYLIGLPAITGILIALISDKLIRIKGWISFIVSIIIFYFAFKIFQINNEKIIFNLTNFSSLSKFFVFYLDPLSKLIVLFIAFFFFVLSLYSIKFVENSDRFSRYWEKFLWTVSASFGAVLSDNLITFTIFWGILGIILYRFLTGEDEKSCASAKKSFIVIGASDTILIFGIVLIFIKTQTYFISEINVNLNSGVAIISFFALLITSLAKAGAFPVHIWVPDYTENAEASVSAILPASLDKLLGIYFLTRIVHDIFILTDWAKFVLLLIGSITIISAVMLALVQHKFKRLLGYHAVSQVGYMVTGIGLGTSIGIAGGLFHMINHALYKSGLFLSAGAVEKKTGEIELENLDGLGSNMPLTFISALICALSISGIPPFNGFASKWTIYQALIDYGKEDSYFAKLWFVWLSFAVIGSAMTLASFIKFIGGIFLGRNEKFKEIKEVHLTLWIPMLLIAVLCVLFGVFSTSYVIPNLFEGISGKFEYLGIWNSTFAAVLIVVSIILGIIIYFIGNLKNIKVRRQFIGGEVINSEYKYNTIQFYKTLNEFKVLDFLYRKAEEKYFDIYELSKKIVLWSSKIFQEVHSGILPLYISWLLLGSLILFIILVL